jgi:WD40 repeat protein
MPINEIYLAHFVKIMLLLARAAKSTLHVIALWLMSGCCAGAMPARLVQVTPQSVVFGAASFSPDGRAIVINGNSALLSVLSTTTWRPVVSRSRDGHASVLSVVFSADGKYIYAGCEDGSVCAFRTRSLKQVWHETSRYPEIRQGVFVVSVAPNHDIVGFGTSVLKGEDEGEDGSRSYLSSTVTFLNANNGKILCAFETRNQHLTICFAFSPDGKTVVIPLNDKVNVYSLPSFRKIASLSAPSKLAVTSISVLPDNRTIVLLRERARIEVRDLYTGKLLRDIRNIGLELDGMALSPGGHLLAVRGFERKSASNMVSTGKSNMATPLRGLSAPGAEQGTSGDNSGNQLWGPPPWAQGVPVGPPPPPAGFKDSGAVWLLNTHTWKIVGTIDSSYFGIDFMTFKPKSSDLAILPSGDGTIEIWRVP